MSMHKFSLAASVAVLALGLGAAAFSTAQQDPPVEGFINDSTGKGQRPAVLTPIAMIGKACSFDNNGQEIEVVVSCTNDDVVDRYVEIHWVRKGTTGYTDTYSGMTAITIAPGQSRTLSTTQSGEGTHPFIVNAYRDEDTDFVGKGVIFSDPEGFRGLTFTAIQVVGNGLGTGGLPQSMNDIPIFRIKDADKARQAGD